MSYARTAVTRMTLDMSRPDLQRSETVTLGDTNRRWEVTLINGGSPFRLPPNWTAALTGIKPDGTGLLNGCSVVDGKIIYDFAAGKEIATCAGNYPVQFDIWDEVGDLVASPKLYINVLADVRPHEELKSDGQYTLIGETLTRISEAEEDINKNAEEISETKKRVEENQKQIEKLAPYRPSAALTTIPPAAWEQADEKDPYNAVFGKAGDNEHITLWAADGASYDWLNTNRPTVSITGDKLMLTAGEKPETELSLVMLTEPFQAEDTEEETVYSYAELAGLQDEAERLGLGKRMTDAEGKIVKLAQTTAVTGSITIHPDEWTDQTPSIASFTVEGLGAGVTVLLIPADIATQTAAREARLSAYPAVFTTVGGQMVEIVRTNEETAPEIPLNFKVVLLRSASESEPTVAMIGVDAYGETAQGGGSGGDTVVVEQSGRMLTIPADSWAETKSLGLSTWITGAIPLDGITPQTMVRLSALDGETASDMTTGQAGAEITYDEETELYSLRVGMIGGKPTVDWRLVMEMQTVEDTEDEAGPWVMVIPPTEDATNKVAAHNYDEAAHPYLYDLIRGLDAEAVGADPAGTAESKAAKAVEQVNQSIAANLASYYQKTETYNRTEIDNRLSSIPKFEIKPVDALPTSGISYTTVYLVKDKTESGDLYTEYIRVRLATGDVWEELGRQRVDLSGYVTEEDLEEALRSRVTEARVNEMISAELSAYLTTARAAELYQPKGDYVVKEAGKGLSTYDYDDTEQARVNQAVTNATDAKAQSSAALAKSNAAESSAAAAAASAAEVQRKVESGELDGEDGAPGTPGYTPKRGTDYWTAEDIEAMRTENEAYIAEELAKRNQLEPLIAESAEWLNENGDPTKVYIVPNANGQGGKVYAYSEVKYNLEPDNVIGENPSRGEKDVNVGVVTGRLSGSTGTVDPDYTNAKTTGFIPCGDNDRITIENWRGYSYTSCYIVAYDTNQAYMGNVSLVWNEVTDGGFLTTSTQNKWADTSKTREEFEMTSYPLSSSNVINKTGIAYIRISSGKGVGSDYAVYVNKEQGGGTVTVSKWYAFCDYIPTENARLDELEREIDLLKAGSWSASDIRTWDKPVFDTAPVTLIEGDTKPSLTGRETVEALYAAYDGLPSRYVTRTLLGDDASGTIPIYRYDVTAPKPHEYSGGGNPAIVKPKVILISGIHYEWVGIWSLFHAIEEICTNPAFRDVLRNAHLIVVPACNPYCLDPNRYSETGGGRQNANGVEIHRNFAVDHEVISEDADNYGGASPLSEPETRYIDQILKENSDAAFFVSCHNFDGGGDTTYGTSFMWASTATNYLYTLGGRFGVKMSEAWEDKYGDVWRQNIDAHKTENQPDGDYTVGMAGKSTSPGTEAKQCMLYGIQGMTFEVGGSIVALGASTADAITVTRGAEVYANLIRTLLATYNPDDKKAYKFKE